MSTTPTAVLKPYSASMNYHQPVPDPLAHFNAIPWCAALLSDPSNVKVAVPDRRPLPNGEASFVHKVMTSPTTVRACVTFIRMVKPPKSKSPPTSAPPSPHSSSSSSKDALEAGAAKEEKPSAPPFVLSGGGRENGEDPRNPFLLLHALAELGVDCQSFPGIMHGGLYGVLLDEVMGTAANSQTANGAYTVRFTTNFRRAVRTPQIVLIRGRVVRKEGRKIHVRGTIEDKDGNVMAEGDGLWLDRTIGSSKL
ncbi:HotDog domain-containing protein [Annulohypoxylon truncatum]|uniref:HotDog domain-containing protein n=1 Tax=Annulohypoxylon truncatum TaxID=327061 RepID=UPI0020078C0F|nr:HotDog domain-containing protein [Annulohypoxylon truncatum]KAI1210886.1 HotDog domain-containing protein [Annulohypoxylon truncatum]